jgi:hypothetical protein
MSNYSYLEIQSMQKKALERVREMRKNSEKLLEETDTTPYIKPKQFFEESNQQVKPKITNMPPSIARWHFLILVVPELSIYIFRMLCYYNM